MIMSVLELRRTASRNVKRLLIKYDHDCDDDNDDDDCDDDDVDYDNDDDNVDNYSGGDDDRDDNDDDEKCDSFGDDKDCCDRFVVFIYFLIVYVIQLFIYRLHDDDDGVGVDS